MADEIITQTTEEIAASNQETRSTQRINELSEKVKLTSQERDELKGLREKDQQRIAELERENSFNSGFADVLTTHSAAKDHKDEIKQKVLAGYTVEDATFAVLGKAGKLGVQETPPSPAGGSSATTPPKIDKTITEMSQDERRAQLEKDLLWS